VSVVGAGHPHDLEYVPDPGFVGIDTFTYRAVNSAGVSNEATAKVYVGRPEVPELLVDGAWSKDGTNDTETILPLNLGRYESGITMAGGLLIQDYEHYGAKADDRHLREATLRLNDPWGEGIDGYWSIGAVDWDVYRVYAP